MTDQSGAMADDVSVLAARVDQLMVLAGVLHRVAQATGFPLSGRRVDRLTDEELVSLLDSLTEEVHRLRGVVVAQHARFASVESDLLRAKGMLRETHQSLAELTRRSEELRVHRDAVVADLLAVQGSRWARLGNILRSALPR